MSGADCATARLRPATAATTGPTSWCCLRGTGAALVLPYAAKQAMTLHLPEIGRAVAPGAHAVVGMDGAEWHKPGGRLIVPENVGVLTLPAYAPGLNPQRTSGSSYVRTPSQTASSRPTTPMSKPDATPGTHSLRNRSASTPSPHGSGRNRSASDAGCIRAVGDDARSNRQAGHADHSCGLVRPRHCLTLACGSHLGQRPGGRANRPDT